MAPSASGFRKCLNPSPIRRERAASITGAWSTRTLGNRIETLYHQCETNGG